MRTKSGGRKVPTFLKKSDERKERGTRLLKKKGQVDGDLGENELHQSAYDVTHAALGTACSAPPERTNLHQYTRRLARHKFNLFHEWPQVPGSWPHAPQNLRTWQRKPRWMRPPLVRHPSRVCASNTQRELSPGEIEKWAGKRLNLTQPSFFCFSHAP